MKSGFRIKDVEKTFFFSCNERAFQITNRFLLFKWEMKNGWTKNRIEVEIKGVKTLRLELPDGLNLNEQALQMTLAVKLYESGQCSLGQAAKVAGVTKRSFIETMGAFGGSIFSGYTTQDYLSDIRKV